MLNEGSVYEAWKFYTASTSVLLNIFVLSYIDAKIEITVCMRACVMSSTFPRDRQTLFNHGFSVPMTYAFKITQNDKNPFPAGPFKSKANRERHPWRKIDQQFVNKIRNPVTCAHARLLPPCPLSHSPPLTLPSPLPPPSTTSPSPSPPPPTPCKPQTPPPTHSPTLTSAAPDSDRRSGGGG